MKKNIRLKVRLSVFELMEIAIFGDRFDRLEYVLTEDTNYIILNNPDNVCKNGFLQQYQEVHLPPLNYLTIRLRL
jgi:hypothetical protein